MNSLQDLIDAYVDGTLTGAARQEFEARMTADPDLRQTVADAATLRADLAALRADVDPARNLWPAIAGQLDEPMPKGLPRWFPIAGLALGAATVATVLLVCVGGLVATQVDAGLFELADPNATLFADPRGDGDLILETIPTDGPLGVGYAALAAGDLPRASIGFEAALQAKPHDPQTLVAVAYTRMLQGDHAGADQALAHAEERAPASAQPTLAVRRALVALADGDLDDVQRHGERSEHPAGLVLAAEVYLADAEAEDAILLLHQARAGADPTVQSAITTYLTYLDDPESGRAELAEATAMWALGYRADAVEVAEDLLYFYPPNAPEHDELLLLWAGRAATSGRPAVAAALLDAISSPPDGQAWRVVGTRAIAHAANEDFDDALELLDLLDAGGAPADGMRDLRLTVAYTSRNGSFARRVLQDVEGAEAALISGDWRHARDVDTPLAAWARDRR